MEKEIEKKVIKQAIKGNQSAFETIVYTYEKKVYNIAYQMFKNEHDAYDASQEIFVKVFNNLKSFQFNSSFSTWLHRIAVNTCIDEYRKKKRHNQKNFSLDQAIRTEDGEMHQQFMDDSIPQIEDKLVQKELIEEVKIAIEHLSNDHKTVIILRDIRGHSYEEIGEIIGCTTGTVKSRISRARHALKDIILKNREQNNISNVK